MNPNDPRIFKLNKSLINSKPPKHPIQGLQGIVYDPHIKAKLIADTIETQFFPSNAIAKA